MFEELNEMELLEVEGGNDGMGSGGYESDPSRGIVRGGGPWVSGRTYYSMR